MADVKEARPVVRAARSLSGTVRREAAQTRAKDQRHPFLWAEKTEGRETREKLPGQPASQPGNPRAAVTGNSQDPACDACGKSPEDWDGGYCSSCGGPVLEP